MWLILSLSRSELITFVHLDIQLAPGEVGVFPELVQGSVPEPHEVVLPDKRGVAPARLPCVRAKRQARTRTHTPAIGRENARARGKGGGCVLEAVVEVSAEGHCAGIHLVRHGCPQHREREWRGGG